MTNNAVVFFPVVEEDEDDFPATTKPDGEYNHNNNGSKEKCEFTRRCYHTFFASFWKEL